MKRLLIALALTCALSGSVLAGDIDTAGAPAPVSGEISTTGTPAPGEMPISGLVVTILDLLF